MKRHIKDYVRNKTILVTGGTGSWGSELVRQLIGNYQPKEIRVFSRGEHKQVAMRQAYSSESRLSYIIGDIRDEKRVMDAMHGVDIVINLAALKHVPVCEENVWEAVQTNIYGVHNIIRAALAMGVHTVVQVSTDKAVDPINTYGYTKGIAERLITSANWSPSNTHGTKFVCVRGGNVLSTVGSVVPLFKHLIATENRVMITTTDMSRYFMRVSEAIGLVLEAMHVSVGGEVLVMNMPGAAIVDLADVMIQELGNAKTKKEIIGIRPGEKVYEVLVSKNEAYRTIVYGSYYVILPEHENPRLIKKYKGHKRAPWDEYTSRSTTQLNKKQILALLREDHWLDDDTIPHYGDLFSKGRQ